jgi:uncharacterized protein (DUF952 family)
MGTRVLYKLLTRAEWEAARAEGMYRGSAHDKRDGFIHFSTASQLTETARKHFRDVPDLLLLAIDAGSLAEYIDQSAVPSASSIAEGFLRWEPARGGQLFPHLYSDLPIAAVRSVVPISLDQNGIPEIQVNCSRE